jgi:hypothetical protein
MNTKGAALKYKTMKPTRSKNLIVGVFASVMAASIGSVLAQNVDANGNTASDSSVAAAKSEVVLNNLPLQTSEDLSYGAVSQSAAAVAGGEEDEEAKLAKDLTNPIASLISVPFQANEDFGYGPSHNGYKFTLNIQPVIPISLTKDWNVIVRTILPVVSQHDLFYVENVPKNAPIDPQNRSQDGLSDTLQSFFFSPKEPGPFGLIWGVGPALLYPTGTHPLLDTGTFSIGPTLVVLKQTGPWTVGALMNQIWSVTISEDRKSVSQMFLQPFLTYTTKTHTTFAVNTESTANWNNRPGDAKWTIPLNLMVSQVLKIGKQPIQLQVGGRYYADSPRYGPDWGLRFTLTLLYPTAKPQPGPVAGDYSK